MVSPIVELHAKMCYNSVQFIPETYAPILLKRKAQRWVLIRGFYFFVHLSLCDKASESRLEIRNTGRR